MRRCTWFLKTHHSMDRAQFVLPLDLLRIGMSISRERIYAFPTICVPPVPCVFEGGMALMRLFQFDLSDLFEAEDLLVHVSIGLGCSKSEVKIEGDLLLQKILFDPKLGYLKLIFLDDGPGPIDLTSAHLLLYRKLY